MAEKQRVAEKADHVKAGKIILEHLPDPRRVFVFPAEVSARFWLRRSFSFASTLDAGRFISWDRFKETCFRYSAGSRMVTDAVRTLFAAAFLERNRRDHLLQSLIPVRHADNSPAFQRSLERILPTLHRLHAATSLSPAKTADLNLLYREYRTFLSRERLTEPGYNRPVFAAGGRRYLLFFPQVLQDYALYSTMLTAEPAVAAVNPPPRSTDTRLLAYENSEEELRRLFLQIAALLDRGVDPEEIVISAANLESLEELLRRMSLLYEVPLRIHGGRALAAQPEARFFTSLNDCVSSGFTLDAVKSLLLDHALPWREQELIRSLIRFGIDHRLVSGAAEPQVWRSAFHRAARSGALAYGILPGGELGALRGFYARLQAGCRSIVNAGSFSRLKESLAAFTAQFFSAPDWDSAGRKRFEYALRILDELIEAESFLPGCAGPFSLWRGSLEQRPYVAPEPGTGVLVYPYRVAAGINPDYHFIINASQQNTRQVVKHFPFLSLDEEEALPGAELDLSAHHIDLYAVSGRTVSFSYARGADESGQLPPASFVIRGRIVPAAAGQAQPAADLYTAERAAWAGGKLPPALFQLQLRGFAAAERSVLLPKTFDLAAGAAAQPPPDLLSAGPEMAEGWLRITPTALESFQACPFRFLIQRGAKIEEEEYQPPLFSARETGELMHRVFQIFNEALLQRNLSLEEKNIPLIGELLAAALAEAGAGHARSHPLPPAPIWRLLLRRIEQLVRFQVELECGGPPGPGQTLLFAEHRLQLGIPGEAVILTGKIDRISRRGEEIMLLDYKKNRLPSKTDIFGSEPVSFQMPFYLYLMEENGLPAARAVYYSLEQQRFLTVWEREEGLEDGSGRLLEQISCMVRDVRAGLYPSLRRSGPACRTCAFRGVCRARYALRALRALPGKSRPEKEDVVEAEA
jgi:RecB family exonuclease